MPKVLNAFWRRGDVDIDANLFFVTLRRAQRLLATGRCGRWVWRTYPSAIRCSTPFGDGAMWTCRHWTVQPRSWPVCSTPFGDGAMWTAVQSLPVTVFSSAQRLLATGRCGLGAGEPAGGLSGVLNAFWRRGDVDDIASAGGLSAQRVLNAFWRRGDVDRSRRSSTVAVGRCSTPFGDGAMWTRGHRGRRVASLVLNAFWRRGDVDGSRASCREATECAQRLLATGRCGLCVSRVPSSKMRSAQRLLATGRCGHGWRALKPLREMCSTPFGDGAMWTSLGLEVAAEVLECSTPFGDGAMWTRDQSDRERAWHVVLNAFWRRGDVDGKALSTSPALPSAQRLLATGRCGHSRCYRLVGELEVLNAFWRRGDVDESINPTTPRRERCSTPFGDGAMWTQLPLLSIPIFGSAQRLLATGRCGHNPSELVDESVRMCSTPFGDGAMWT